MKTLSMEEMQKPLTEIELAEISDVMKTICGNFSIYDNVRRLIFQYDMQKETLNKVEQYLQTKCGISHHDL